MSDRLLKESDVLKIAFQLPYVVNSAFFDAVKALPSADRPQGEVDAVEIYEKAENQLESNEITIGEFEKIVEPLRHLFYNRPQGEWIFHYRDKWMVKAECPKCHRRFEFSPRAIWKCCPMCETRMKGADDD